MSGITATGFAIKTLDTVRAEIESTFVSVFGTGVDLSADGPVGQFIGIMAEREADLWKLQEAVYLSLDPSSNTGQSLDNSSNLSGTFRRAATFASVTCTFGGLPSSAIPSGQIIAKSTGERLVTIGDFVTDLAGSVNVPCVAENIGALTLPAGSVDTIVTPIPNITTVTNSSDGISGTNEESDSELRTRRKLSLQLVGSGNDLAVQARLSALTGVASASVSSNREMIVVDGAPAKSMSAVLYPAAASPSDAYAVTIAEEIFRSMSSGIEAFGTETYTVEDTRGTPQPVAFSYATGVDVWIEIDITVDVEVFPVDGAAQVDAAVLAWGNTHTIGDDVILPAIVCQVMSVPGVLSVVVRADTVTPAVGVINLPISRIQIALFSAARIATVVT